jgi:NTP pyrophosphatase (non-canonical NTP hydrolase)
MLTFSDLQLANRQRCEHPEGFNHPLSGWSLSDWMTATCGELGEAANVLKKLNRSRDGVRGNIISDSDLRKQFASELADTVIYLDLMAQAAGIDLGRSVAETFNARSRQIGYRGQSLRG